VVGGVGAADVQGPGGPDLATLAVIGDSGQGVGGGSRVEKTDGNAHAKGRPGLVPVHIGENDGEGRKRPKARTNDIQPAKAGKGALALVFFRSRITGSLSTKVMTSHPNHRRNFFLPALSRAFIVRRKRSLEWPVWEKRGRIELFSVEEISNPRVGEHLKVDQQIYRENSNILTINVKRKIVQKNLIFQWFL
jgi:hypothetical protein